MYLSIVNHLWGRLLTLCWLVILLLITLQAVPVLASPPIEGIQTRDWIKLNSGEWVAGEIIVLYQDTLEFDSDKLNTLFLDWDDIAEIHGASLLQLRLKDDAIMLGKLLMEDNEIRMDYISTGYMKDDVLGIMAGVDKEENYWTAKVSFGTNIVTGNSNQLDFDTSIHLKRRTIDNRLTINYLDSFSRVNDDTTIDTSRLTLSWDHFITRNIFWQPVVFEAFSDPLLNIERRVTIGMGIGYSLFDTGKFSWDVSGGPAYEQIHYGTVEEGKNTQESSGSLVFGTTIGYEFNQKIDLVYQYSGSLQQEELGSYKHHMRFGIEIELSDRLDLDISTQWDRVGTPQPDAEGNTPKSDDWRFIIGIGYSF